VDPVLFSALIVKVGIPLAEELMKLVNAGGKVTPEMWDALKLKNAISGESLIPQRPT